MLWNSISKIFDIEFHNIKSNNIDLGGDINLQMISPLEKTKDEYEAALQLHYTLRLLHIISR